MDHHLRVHSCYDRNHLVVVQGEGSSLTYYFGVGLAWTLLAVVLDYVFIVQLFGASYYEVDVYFYYALTFLMPVGVGLYLLHIRKENVTG